MSPKLLPHGGVAALAAVALVLAVPLSASAHVRVYPKQAVAGADDTLLTFSVPTESGSATTTRVMIDLPTATRSGAVVVSRTPQPFATASRPSRSAVSASL